MSDTHSARRCVYWRRAPRGRGTVSCEGDTVVRLSDCAWLFSRQDVHGARSLAYCRAVCMHFGLAGCTCVRTRAHADTAPVRGSARRT